jgi:hypothetical protein
MEKAMSTAISWKTNRHFTTSTSIMPLSATSGRVFAKNIMHVQPKDMPIFTEPLRA